MPEMLHNALVWKKPPHAQTFAQVTPFFCQQYDLIKDILHFSTRASYLQYPQNTQQETNVQSQ